MEKDNEKRKSEDLREAMFFAWRDLKYQKKRTIFIVILFLTMAGLSALFIGELFVYKDDRITRKYDTSAFMQKNDRRLSVRRVDGSRITEKDRKQIEKIKYVEDVDLYDYVNDIQYDVSKRMKNPSYMRSTTGITKMDLVKGRMPQNRLEILVSSGDAKLLGKKKTYYFACENIWPKGEKCWFKMKVVGVCDRKGSQLYFDPKFCHMLCPALDGYSYKMDYDQDEMSRRFTKSFSFYPIVSDDLKGRHVRVSKNYVMDAFTGSNGDQINVYSAFSGMRLPFHITKTEGGSVVSVGETEDTTEAQVYTFNNGYLDVDLELIDQGGEFVEVSQKLFDEIYPEQTTQASVYISHYTKTDKVIKKLQKAGYDAISTYQVSATSYIASKVWKRLYIISFSAVTLIILAFMMYFLLRQFIRMQQGQLQTLRFMGMRQRPLELNVYIQMLLVDLSASVVMLVAMAVIRLRSVTVHRIWQYQSVWSLLWFFGYNLAVAVVATALTLMHFRSSEGWQNGGMRNGKNR